MWIGEKKKNPGQQFFFLLSQGEKQNHMKKFERDLQGPLEKRCKETLSQREAAREPEATTPSVACIM